MIFEDFPMLPITYAHLTDRGIISVSGADSRDFLQGLISNNITLVTANKAIYAALLTPQGKYLHDFFISQSGDKLLIECEKSQISDLINRLQKYKLRANADLLDETKNYSVLALWGNGVDKAMGLNNIFEGSAQEKSGGVQMIDPRLGIAGGRVIVPVNIAENEIKLIGAEHREQSDYDLHRLKLGLPNATIDLIIDKSTLIESGFDELNGIDWNKGCYMGQELTARTKYRGLVKKRLVSVTIKGHAPKPGTPIMVGDINAGEMRSSNTNHGIALVRLDQLRTQSARFKCDQSILYPIKPKWAKF